MKYLLKTKQLNHKEKDTLDYDNQVISELCDSGDMRRAKCLIIKNLQKTQTHSQGAASKAPSNSPTRGEKEVFLNQRVSAYRFHESLNLGVRHFLTVWLG